MIVGGLMLRLWVWNRRGKVRWFSFCFICERFFNDGGVKWVYVGVVIGKRYFIYIRLWE